VNGLLTRGRVIYLHMRRPHWFVVTAGLLVAVLLFMAAPTAKSSLLACGLAGTVLLWCYGAALAVATLTTAATGLALAPGAQRAVWRAAGAIGLIAIVMVSVAIFIVAWLAAEPGSGLPWLATASLALASGFALMVAANSRHGRTLFWAIALLPLTALPLTRTGEPPGPWPLALWALAWPACVGHSARVMTSMVQGRPPAPNKPMHAAWLLVLESLN
jgi:hypothetical protein